MRIILFNLIFIALYGSTSFSQTFVELGFNQPPQLIADAGADVSIVTGSQTSLGGSPSASGGTVSYSYLWSPASGLNSTTVANPVASPTQTKTYTLTVIDAAGCTTTDQVIVTVTNSIPENSSEKIKLFPNPTSQTLKVEFDRSMNLDEYAIFDNQGRMIERHKIEQGTENIDYDISQLPKGTYVIRLFNKQVHYDKSFICE